MATYISYWAGAAIGRLRHQIQRLAHPEPAVAQPNALLTGPALLRARAVWLGFVGLSIVSFLTALPALARDTRDAWLVQQAYRALAPGVPLDTFAGYINAWRLAVTVTGWLVALYLFARQSADRMALFAAGLLVCVPLSVTIGDGPRNVWLDSIALATPLGVLLFLFIFPDGRFVPRSSRMRGGLLVAVLPVPFVAYRLLHTLAPQYAPDEWAYGAIMALFATLIALGIASQAYRYRILSTPAQRQQTKWVLFSLSLYLIWMGWFMAWLFGLLERLGLTVGVIALVQLHLIMLLALIFPLTVGFSVLRYRLWDVDALLRRTLVYGLLTALVVALYVLVVGGLGLLLRTRGSPWLTLLAIGLGAALAHPLRQRLQQGVNRLLYGQRDDPLAVLTRLGEQLEATTPPGQTLSILVATVAQALKLPYVAATVQRDGAFQVAADVGAAPPEPPEAIPLVYQGETIGQLLVAPRAPGEALSPAERQLLANLARQGGAAVHAAQLTAQLQQSRARLVTAQEEERRRLRRNLHDGLGPQLASLSLQVDAARNLLRANPAAADRRLAELRTQLQTAVTDIRRLVYDLRPPALDQLGLVPALRDYAAACNAGEGVEIAIETPAVLPPLPAAVEVAAYRIALEAMANVVRHAQARHCTVRLALAEGLRIEVQDDGQGLPAGFTAGVGLTAMRERVAELGGTLTIQPSPHGGTVARAWLPCAVAEDNP